MEHTLVLSTDRSSLSISDWLSLPLPSCHVVGFLGPFVLPDSFTGSGSAEASAAPESPLLVLVLRPPARVAPSCLSRASFSFLRLLSSSSSVAVSSVSGLSSSVSPPSSSSVLQVSIGNK